MSDELTEPFPHALTLARIFVGTGIAMAVLSLLRSRHNSPVLDILRRWARWLGIACGWAFFAAAMQWVDRSAPVLLGMGLLGWLLLETLYHWFAVSALSQSPLPLFPVFQTNREGDTWPAQPRFLRLRQRMRAAGFTPVAAAKAEAGPDVALRVSIFHDAAATTRLQVLFLPTRGGPPGVAYSLATCLADGRRLVTDNLYLPFGGYFPEEFEVERRPWTRGFPALLGRHLSRVAAAGAVAVPWEGDPVEDLNHQQRRVEQLNVRLGILRPADQREEDGKLTDLGRYRVWREVLLLRYFGLTAHRG